MLNDSMVNAPHSLHFDDIYFSAENGLEESRYVFLKQNHLPDAWLDKSDFVIGETGFGTGLNFLCAWTEFEKTTKPNQKLHYYSVEKYPLAASEIQKYLMHWSGEFAGRLEKLVEEYPLRLGGWHTLHLSSQVTLTLMFDDVGRALPELNTPIDCWFLDGHAPAKNSDMWSEIVFENIGRLSYQGTRCSTFTAAGAVKRGLKEAGFTVTKATGYGRKRDMIVGLYEKKIRPIQTKYTPKRIALIGGGIAGATLASSLSEYASDITIFEKKALASGGSGNSVGLCNPRMTQLRGSEADFYSPAFNLAHKLFEKVSKKNEIGYRPSGNLHIITDPQKEKRFHGFINNWGWHPEHALLLDPHESSAVAGISLKHSSLYLPDAGMVSPKNLTEHLAKKSHLILYDVLMIEKNENQWCINGQSFDALILTGGYDVLRFEMTKHLPLQKIRGQITQVKVEPAYQNLKTNLSYGGYCSVSVNGESIIGSTFQHWIDDDTLRSEDDVDNINKLTAISAELTHGLIVTGGRVSFRCAAKDRTPIIGSCDGFENVYASTAHGSHGILSALMGAELLASKIFNKGQILPDSLEKSLSPNRFRPQ
jgi:tRNA 5-methylaminomethyl-2-thiouridine biosynthesis bifunctional protein